MPSFILNWLLVTKDAQTWGGSRKGKTHSCRLWLSNYTDNHMMRGFGASLRNDLCTTEETFPLVLLFEMMILRRNAAVIDESQFIWVHTPLKYWYLSSKSFSTRPPNSHRTRLCSVSSLSHIKLFPSLCIVLFHFSSCAFSSLFDKKKLPLSFYFLYPVSFFLTPSCSLIFTLCHLFFFISSFLDFLIFTSQSLHRFPSPASLSIPIKECQRAV